MMLTKGLKGLAWLTLPAALGAVVTWTALTMLVGEAPEHSRAAIMTGQSEGLTPVLAMSGSPAVAGGAASALEPAPESQPTGNSGGEAPAADSPGRQRAVIKAPTRRASEPGRLAIVIDDIGHNLHRPREFLALELPLTFSVLPGLRYSRRAAGMIAEAGREYLIHLPMEPFDYPGRNPGPEPLLLSQGERQIQQRLEGYFASLPQAIGASNHMGSAYTYDAARMGVVLRLIAGRGLLFLNSKTSSSPVPSRIARGRGYSYLERDVFLDNVRDLPSVRRQLARAVRLARERGRAVAIGHPLVQTYRVIRDDLGRALGSGVQLVELSRLAE